MDMCGATCFVPRRISACPMSHSSCIMHLSHPRFDRPALPPISHEMHNDLGRCHCFLLPPPSRPTVLCRLCPSRICHYFLTCWFQTLAPLTLALIHTYIHTMRILPALSSLMDTCVCSPNFARLVSESGREDAHPCFLMIPKICPSRIATDTELTSCKLAGSLVLPLVP